MSIQDELFALQDSEGIIDAKVVLKWAAAHPKSELYKKIEWKDKDAAHEYRLIQVRKLIIIYTTNVYREPTMVSLTTDRINGGGYRRVDDVIDDVSLRDIALRDAINFLRRAYDRYSYLVELAGVKKELDLIESRSFKPPPDRPESPRPSVQ